MMCTTLPAGAHRQRSAVCACADPPPREERAAPLVRASLRSRRSTAQPSETQPWRGLRMIAAATTQPPATAGSTATACRPICCGCREIAHAPK
eukprot:7075166-Prymnesium_polylepis.2